MDSMSTIVVSRYYSTTRGWVGGSRGEVHKRGSAKEQKSKVQKRESGEDSFISSISLISCISSGPTKPIRPIQPIKPMKLRRFIACALSSFRAYELAILRPFDLTRFRSYKQCYYLTGVHPLNLRHWSVLSAITNGLSGVPDSIA